jgi:hypothetical protein
LESTPGNANLPIGDGTEVQNANREIGVPRVRQSTTELKVKLGHYRGIRSIVTKSPDRLESTGGFKDALRRK